VTRARSHLYLTYPLLRVTGSRDELSQKPSRFLAEIPPALVEVWNLRLPGGF
jgi:superfamily I DNA/RNA helicase